ncbi:MAG: YwbE family protein [Polyangiaceae bacterium]|nr:YwbE family protein [Polyangiaceae bacterium]
MEGTRRADIRPGLRVRVVLKPDRRSGKQTEGVVKDTRTRSSTRSRVIKVRLETGEVGRVREIVNDDPA